MGIRTSRDITRLASQAIKNIHQGKMTEAARMLDEGARQLNELRRKLRLHPEIQYAGFLHNAEKELIEGVITYGIIAGKTIPDPSRHGFDLVSFLHGAAESVGELRRYILDTLRKGDTARGEEVLRIMDEVYFFLLSFVYPDALTRHLRKQVDYVRSMLERTRTDVTNALLFSPKREQAVPKKKKAGAG